MRNLLTLVAVLAGPAIGSAMQQPPVIPGLHQRHPLSEAEVGDLLLGELRCAACHGEDFTSPVLETPRAPDLREVGARVSSAYLRSFLADPAASDPGTTMPQLLTSLNVDERAEVADALTHFLVSRASADFEGAVVDPLEARRGRQLYRRVGCVTCHGLPADEDEAEAASELPHGVDLEQVRRKYSLPALSEFLYQPLLARPAGRMPDLGLSTTEAREVASYLLAEGAPEAPTFTPQPELVARGERWYAQLKCAACHEPEAEAPATPLRRGEALDTDAGCLAARPREAPDYALDEDQRGALVRALEGPTRTPSEEQRVAATLTAFNCIGCHVRDDYGGVTNALSSFFETDEHDLGDHARIPPRLTLAGAKLRPEWLRRVLFDRGRVRPYMFTRMPQYGEANLAHLPALLERVDELEPLVYEPMEGEAGRASRDAGRELLGTTGLACISCHDFNTKPSPGFGGIDLITTCERLQPAWYARFLVAPEELRPGIVMPQSWPGGVAAHTGILEGDTDAQLQAIWHFLSLGRSARDPVGIRSVRTVLEVGDAVRTYRGRSQVAGFRGIAVGFPGGASYAFDARNGALAALWSGGFVSVRWDGQGAGGFNPVSRSRALPRDLGIHRFEDEREPWPLRPVMTEEQPVDPDPLYPRNLGYRFEGYSLDGELVPTFRYRSGEVRVEDRSAPHLVEERSVLRRTLKLDSPAPAVLHMRVLTGEVETLAPGSYAAGGVRVDLPESAALLRSVATDPASLELLLRLDLPAGSTTLTLDYELQP